MMISTTKKEINPTEVKKYKVTPVKNRFVPDILKNDRIEEPGIYMLNPREVKRASWYSVVEEVNEPVDPPEIVNPDDPVNPYDWAMMDHARIGYARLHGGVK